MVILNRAVSVDADRAIPETRRHARPSSRRSGLTRESALGSTNLPGRCLAAESELGPFDLAGFACRSVESPSVKCRGSGAGSPDDPAEEFWWVGRKALGHAGGAPHRRCPRDSREQSGGQLAALRAVSDRFWVWR